MVLYYNYCLRKSRDGEKEKETAGTINEQKWSSRSVISVKAKFKKKVEGSEGLMNSS